MNVKVEYSDEDLVGFSEEAKRKLQEIILENSQSIISECLRLDSGEHDSKEQPDINRTIVEKASLMQKNNLVKIRKPWFAYIPSIVSSISGLVTGIVYKDPFTTNAEVIFFATSLLIFGISTTLVFLIGDKHGK